MYIYGYLLKAAVTHLNGRLKTILPFGAFNLTLPYSSIQDDMLQTNISYSRVLHDFLKSTSRRYFNEPYTFGYKGCCWQVLQSNDPIASVSDASTNQQLEQSLEFEIIAKVFDVNNVAPRIVLPSVWYINVGCDSSLDLHPFDQDIDDVIRCRWANQDEAGFAAFDNTDHPFLKLASEKCEIEFDALKFKDFSANSTLSKSKFSIPIAIMIEDFANHRKRSSMPAQFFIATLPSTEPDASDVLNQDSIDDKENQTDVYIDNGQQLFNCDLIPVLFSIEDLFLSSQEETESKIKRSFDIYEGGRNGINLTKIVSDRVFVFP